jgi:hypothetical protein
MDCHSDSSEESPHFARSKVHYAIAEIVLALKIDTKLPAKIYTLAGSFAPSTDYNS